MPTDHPTLAVLAGGQSTRMGRPKSHLLLNGRPILQDLLDRLHWPGPTLLVTAPGRQHPPASDHFEAEVTDPVENEGPLRGLLTALDSCATDMLAVLTLDMPAIGRDQIDWLVDELKSRPTALALMLRRSDDGEDRIEPFPSAYRRSASDVVKAQLAAAKRSVHSLSSLPQFLTLPAPAAWPPATWANLNRPEDVDQFLSGN
jgi:molybdopterin-guanine dinucleotide biosynthesis protein A